MIEPPPTRFMCGMACVLGGEHDAFHIHRHHLVPLLFGDLEDVGAHRDTHVVVQDVKTPIVLDGRLHHRLAVGQPRNVSADGGRSAALPGDHVDGRLRPFEHCVGADDLGTLAGEEDGGRLLPMTAPLAPAPATMATLPWSLTPRGY